MATARPTLLELAAATPATRDRYADFLRAFSILVVVFGHWLIAVVTWQDGKVDGANALEVIDGLWTLTWLLQVMPLFFFIGGFSNLRSWTAMERRGESYAGFLHSRLLRMMRPTAVFLGIGLVVVVTLDAANVADNAVFPASRLIARPLWFLGVYMIVVALAPLMIELHRRFGIWVLIAMVAIAAVIDTLRFGGDISAFGWVNYPVVWLLAHQLGFFYADGALVRLRWWAAATGFGGMLLLVNLGPYPGSMVGLSTDEFSNMDPPTMAIVALILWQVGFALVLRPPITRWLQRARVWAGVIFVNTVIMTVFLWHLTALLFGIGVLFPLGFPQPEAGSAQWWALRPVWIAVLLVILAALVAAFGRFEARGLGKRAPRVSDSAGGRAATSAAVVGASLVVLGVLGFAMGGMHQLFSTTGAELIIFNLNPALSVIHIALGWLLLRGAVAGHGEQLVACVIASAGLLALGVLGLVSLAGDATNYLAINTADNVFHITAAAISGMIALLVARRDRATEALGDRVMHRGAD